MEGAAQRVQGHGLNNISFGTCPDIGLAAARKRADEARKLVAEGVDPIAARTAAKIQGQDIFTFDAAADDWLSKVHEPGVSARHCKRSLTQLDRCVQPNSLRATTPFLVSSQAGVAAVARPALREIDLEFVELCFSGWR